MTRVKKAVNAIKYRRNLLKAVKGYRFGRSKKERMANEAMFHAGSYAFAHRRDKKGDMRKAWQVTIGAMVKEKGMSYSKFIGALKNKKIELDRKILADLAQNHTSTFSEVIAKIK
jgi:large subunit ribosomal protein L20